MPRDGSGAADNKVSDTPEHTIAHGAGGDDGKTSAGVDRSDKAVPAPELEKGEALDGLSASGGGASVSGSGKGPIEATVDKEAKK